MMRKKRRRLSSGGRKTGCCHVSSHGDHAVDIVVGVALLSGRSRPAAATIARTMLGMDVTGAGRRSNRSVELLASAIAETAAAMWDSTAPPSYLDQSRNSLESTSIRGMGRVATSCW